MSRASALLADVERLRREVTVARSAIQSGLDCLVTVEEQLSRLSLEVAQLSENSTPASQPESWVHIEQQFVYANCPPSGASEAAGAAGPAAGAAAPSSTPSSGVPQPGPKSRFWYAVSQAGPPGGHRGWGLYRDYQGFCDAVRDHTVEWSDRGKIPWAPGAHGQKFGSESEALSFLTESLKLAADAAVPRHPSL